MEKVKANIQDSVTNEKAGVRKSNPSGKRPRPPSSPPPPPPSPPSTSSTKPSLTQTHEVPNETPPIPNECNASYTIMAEEISSLSHKYMTPSKSQIQLSKDEASLEIHNEFLTATNDEDKKKPTEEKKPSLESVTGQKPQPPRKPLCLGKPPPPPPPRKPRLKQQQGCDGNGQSESAKCHPSPNTGGRSGSPHGVSAGSRSASPHSSSRSVGVHSRSGSPSAGNTGPRSGSPSAGNAGPRSGSPSAGNAGPRSGSPSAGNTGPRSGSPSAGNTGPRSGSPSAGNAGPRFGSPSAGNTGPRSGSPSAGNTGPRSGSPSAGNAGSRSGSPSAGNTGPRSGSPSAGNAGSRSGSPSAGNTGPWSGSPSAGAISGSTAHEEIKFSNDYGKSDLCHAIATNSKCTSLHEGETPAALTNSSPVEANRDPVTTKPVTVKGTTSSRTVSPYRSESPSAADKEPGLPSTQVPSPNQSSNALVPSSRKIERPESPRPVPPPKRCKPKFVAVTTKPELTAESVATTPVDLQREGSIEEPKQSASPTKNLMTSASFTTEDLDLLHKPAEEDDFENKLRTDSRDNAHQRAVKKDKRRSKSVGAPAFTSLLNQLQAEKNKTLPYFESEVSANSDDKFESNKDSDNQTESKQQSVKTTTMEHPSYNSLSGSDKRLSSSTQNKSRLSTAEQMSHSATVVDNPGNTPPVLSNSKTMVIMDIDLNKSLTPRRPDEPESNHNQNNINERPSKPKLPKKPKNIFQRMLEKNSPESKSSDTQNEPSALQDDKSSENNEMPGKNDKELQDSLHKDTKKKPVLVMHYSVEDDSVMAQQVESTPPVSSSKNISHRDSKSEKVKKKKSFSERLTGRKSSTSSSRSLFYDEIEDKNIQKGGTSRFYRKSETEADSKNSTEIISKTGNPTEELQDALDRKVSVTDENDPGLKENIRSDIDDTNLYDNNFKALKEGSRRSKGRSHKKSMRTASNLPQELYENIKVSTMERDTYDSDSDTDYYDSFSDESESCDEGDNTMVQSNSAIEKQVVIEELHSEPKSKLQNIAHELLTTERTYVKRLHLVDQVFQFKILVENRAHHMFPDSVIPQMFSNIKSIYQFHHDFLLAQLEKRMTEWEQCQKIGDLMKKFAPFLKLYTDYVQNFDTAMNTINTWMDKSLKFASLIDELQKTPECGGLTLQHHMLEPIQRVPRYELLLKDYIKNLPEDSNDKADALEALTLVTTAASHSNQAMAKIEKFRKLLEINESLGGAVDLIGPTRELVKEGKVIKLSQRNAYQSERYLFLFTDMLLVCNALPVMIGPVQYKMKAQLSVEGMQVLEGDNLVTPDTFYVKSKQKSMEFHFSSNEEKMDWHVTLLNVISEYTRKQITRQSAKEVAKTPEEEVIKDKVSLQQDGKEFQESALGLRAPTWIKDQETSMCMVCSSTFTKITRRRHHCRACGMVVCGKCSSQKAKLPYDDFKLNRVCDRCDVILNNGKLPLERPYPQAAPRRKGVLQVRATDKSVLNGYLHMSQDKKTWQKRWFAAHDDFVLYSFKAHQDVAALTSLPLPGYQIQDETEGHDRENVFKLFHQGQKKAYYFQADDKFTLNKWKTVLTALTIAELPDSVV